MRRTVFVLLTVVSTLTLALFVLTHQVELGSMYTLYRFTGPFVTNCGFVPADRDPARSAACVRNAQSQGKPFVAVIQMAGRDSVVTYGIASKRSGERIGTGYDSYGENTWSDDGPNPRLQYRRFFWRKIPVWPCKTIEDVSFEPGRLHCPLPASAFTR